MRSRVGHLCKLQKMKLLFHTASHLGAILPQEIGSATLFAQMEVCPSLTDRETMGSDATICGQSITQNKPATHDFFFNLLCP